MVEIPWRSGSAGQLLIKDLKLVNVHAVDHCSDEWACPIHCPTAHHMRSWPATWDGSIGLIGRICPHGFEHPDPDSAIWVEEHYGDHSLDHECDGCCSG